MKNYLQFILFKRIKNSEEWVVLHSLCIFMEYILLFFRTSYWYDCILYRIEVECLDQEGNKEIIKINMDINISTIPREETRNVIKRFIKFLDNHSIEIKKAEAIRIYIRAYPK
jgi:hypothetical protein